MTIYVQRNIKKNKIRFFNTIIYPNEQIIWKFLSALKCVCVCVFVSCRYLRHVLVYTRATYYIFKTYDTNPCSKFAGPRKSHFSTMIYPENTKL